MKQSFLGEHSTQIVVTEGEVIKGQPFEAEYVAPDSATHAVILVETLSGSTRLSFSAPSLSNDIREERSQYKKVCLRLIQVAENFKSIALSITAATKASVRITIAFIKREATNLRKSFSCRLCKQLCRLAVSAMLAYFGIPYLDAEASVDMPGINPPEMTTGGKGPFFDDPLKNILNPDVKVPVQVGGPVEVNDSCKSFLAKPDSGPTWLKDLFESIDPKAIAGVHAALEVAEWMFDATDRLYTSACKSIGMCKSESA